MIFRLISIILALILICNYSVTQAQLVDTLPLSNEDTSQIVSDDRKQDTSGIDSFRISDEALTVPVTFQARDSMVYSAKDKVLRMYGRDSVVTEEATLTAGYIEYNIGQSEALAQPSKDTIGRYINFPKILEGQNQVDATQLRYNFKSGKARIIGARTKEGDLFIVGTRSKYVDKDKDASDTTSKKIIYNDNAILTTCNAPKPHFGIRSGKQKVVTNEWAVMGPSYFEIGGIPTPLILPFAAVPLKKGRRTGLIFPNNYTSDDRWGYGLRNIGWYFPINDYWDAQLTADVFLRGSYAVHTQTRYAKRYKFDGRINLDYSSYKQETVVNQELKEVRDKSFGLSWVHNQDAKAHPLRNFSADLNMQTNNYLSLNNNTAQAVFKNTFNSRINFRQKFANRNWLLTASLDHSQNVATREFEIEFPRITFTTNSFKPFKRENAVGREKWYEKITVNYSGKAVNRLETRDTAIFIPNILDSMQYGVAHAASADMNFNLFKYLNVTPSINYNEDWLFRTTRKQLNPEPIITNIDTIFNKADSSDFTIEADTSYSTVNEELVNEFRALRTFNTSLNMNTQIFGTLRFSKGWLRGLRHVIKPSLSLTYNPDFTGPGYNYFDTYQSDLRPEEAEEVQYSIFENNIFRRQPSTSSSLILSYSINNIFEAKYYSKKDSTEKNFKLFRNITINGNYDFFRDSLKFSDIRMNGYFPIFRNIINFRFSASFSPYAVNDDGKKIDKFQWDINRNIIRFQDLNMGISTQFTVKEIRQTISELFQDKEKTKPKQSQTPSQTQSSPQSIWSLVDGMRVSHNLNIRVEGRPGRDTFMITTNQLSLVGSIPLTEKWNIQVGNIGYDFTRDAVTYPDFGFSRDLHCWEMSLRWQPKRNTYTFSIYVKPGSLDFMKIPYQRSRVEGAAQF